MRIFNKKCFFVFLVVLSVFSCSNSKKITNQEVTYVYDDNGRRVKLKSGDKQSGDILIYQYDQDGNVSKIILKDDKGDKLEQQQYDQEGNIVKNEDYANSKLIGFTTYDNDGQESSKSFIDENGQVTTFVYEYDGEKIAKQTKKRGEKVVFAQEYKYEEGKAAGVQTINDNGTKTYDYDEKIVKETLTDSKGNIVYQYEKNGEKNSQKYSHYVNGFVDKVMECFLSENRMREENYKNGKILNASESDFDGNKLRDEEYKNGKLVGYIQYLREEGKLVGRKAYSADNKLKRYYKYATKNGVTQIVTYDGSGNIVEYED